MNTETSHQISWTSTCCQENLKCFFHHLVQPSHFWACLNDCAHQTIHTDFNYWYFQTLSWVFLSHPSFFALFYLLMISQMINPHDSLLLRDSVHSKEIYHLHFLAQTFQLRGHCSGSLCVHETCQSEFYLLFALYLDQYLRTS